MLPSTREIDAMLQWYRRRRARPDEPDPTPFPAVTVTYMTNMGLGRCRLYDARWCYRRGRLALVGERRAGCAIGFDFDQILALRTVAETAPEPVPVGAGA